MTADADGANARQLARLGGNEQFLLNGPSWSPDGRVIVAGVQSFRGAPKGLVYSADVASGRVEKVGTAEWRTVGDVAWLPDGRGFVLVASDMTSGSQIWQVAYPSGDVSRITNDLNTYVGVSVSSDGKTIATIQAENTSHIWVAPDGDMTRGKEVSRGRTDGQAGLAWTPDGRIVFSGALSGRQQIFVMNADGANVQQLTRDDQAGAAQPAISPDGQYVVYQKVKAAEIGIWRVGIDGANPLALTSGGFDVQPVFSPDGRSVYYNTPAAGTPHMFRVSIDGGTPAKVSDKFFRAAGMSGDGKWLLGLTWDAKARRSAGARLSVDGQTLEILQDLPANGSAIGPGPGHLTFVRPTEKGWMLSVRDAAGAVRDLYALSDTIFNTAWSRDGKTLAAARGTTSSDVVLISRKVEAR
jgi:Tol biopolymer transport system component